MSLLSKAGLVPADGLWCIMGIGVGIVCVFVGIVCVVVVIVCVVVCFMCVVVGIDLFYRVKQIPLLLQIDFLINFK